MVGINDVRKRNEPEPEPESFGPNSELKFGFGACLVEGVKEETIETSVLKSYEVSKPHPLLFFEVS